MKRKWKLVASIVVPVISGTIVGHLGNESRHSSKKIKLENELDEAEVG